MSTVTRKQELRAKLAASRLQFDGNWSAFKDDANVPRRVGDAVRKRKTIWIGGATIIGFILSRLPARKKEVLIDAKSRKKLEGRKEAGFLMVLVKLLLGVLRPAVTAYATKKLADMAASSADAKEAEVDAREAEAHAKEAEADVREEKRKERALPG